MLDELETLAELDKPSGSMFLKFRGKRLPGDEMMVLGYGGFGNTPKDVTVGNSLVKPFPADDAYDVINKIKAIFNDQDFIGVEKIVLDIPNSLTGPLRDVLDYAEQDPERFEIYSGGDEEPEANTSGKVIGIGPDGKRIDRTPPKAQVGGSSRGIASTGMVTVQADSTGQKLISGLVSQGKLSRDTKVQGNKITLRKDDYSKMMSVLGNAKFQQMFTKVGSVAEAPVNELSKDTLRAYSKDAGREVGDDQRDARSARDQAIHHISHGNLKKGADWSDEADWLNKRAEKRASGIARATSKIAQKGVAEDTDQDGFHTRVQRGDFRPSKYGEDEYNYLHDLMNTGGDGDGPMLVTINDKKIARQIAAMYGGDVEETSMGTYRIVQRRGDSPMGNKRPKLTGVAEGPHGGDDYTLGNPVDKEYVYQVWRTANDVRDYENMGKWVHDGGTTHSLADAKRRKDALIKGTHGVKAKIVRVPRSQFKLAGPQGHLPEEMGRRGVAERADWGGPLYDPDLQKGKKKPKLSDIKAKFPPNPLPKNPVPKEQGVAEGSEWETKHDEFTTVGDRATPEQIHKIVSALGVAAKQAGSKRGFLNQIIGKQSNGDLARMAHNAETLAKNIQRNSNAKPGTDERKELGQHLVYAVSLLKRMNGEQGVAEDDGTPGYIKYEQMKDKISSVLIKLYNQGKDPETIKQMGDRVAHHLGYDPEDSIFQDAWMTSFTDASLDGSLDQDDEDDYTDYSMRRGERGMEEGDDQPDHEISMASSELQSIAKDAANLLDMVRQKSEEEGLEAWQQSKITKAADFMNSVLQSLSGDEEGVAEGSLTDKQQSYWDNVAREKKDKEREALKSKKAEYEKTPVGKAEKYWSKQGVAEGYGSFQGKLDREKDDFKRRELDAELGDEGGRNHRPASPPPKGMYFYNVRPGKERTAQMVGLKQTKNGKWYSKYPNPEAGGNFGPGKYWEPKSEGVGEGSKQQLPVVMYKEISPDMTQGREFFQVVQSQSPFWKVGDTFSDDDMSMGSRQVRFVSVEQGVAEGLRDPKDNPCWKGYKPVGTKKKGGKTVPNCVPTNEDAYINQLMAALESKK
jgi:hypothetical protein